MCRRAKAGLQPIRADCGHEAKVEGDAHSATVCVPRNGSVVAAGSGNERAKRASVWRPNN